MAADSAGQLKSKGSGQSRLLERDLCDSLFVVHCSLLSMFIAVDVVVRSMEADERRRDAVVGSWIDGALAVRCWLYCTF